MASRGLPIAARRAVAEVPMLAPRIRAIPESRVIKPCWASTMTIPVVAADDWMSAVNPAPTAIPRNGFSNRAMASMKASAERSGAIASPMMSCRKTRDPDPSRPSLGLTGPVLRDERHREADDHRQSA